MTDERERIDALVRAASARPVDEAALTRAVQTRLNPRQRWAAWPSLGPNMAAAGFAAMLLVAGFTGYSLPDLDGANGDILLLSTIEPGMLDLPLITLDAEDGS